MTNRHTTFSDLVDEAVRNAKEKAAPFVPSRAEYEVEFRNVCNILGDFADPRAFMKATHRGAGTMDSVVSNLFMRLEKGELS